jgi:hypothetical protein
MAKKKKSSAGNSQDKLVPLLIVLGLALVIFLGVFAVQSFNGTASKAANNGTTGNGAPNGAHFNLNIIGVPKAKTADMTGGGSRLFVPLEGKSQILLSEGPDFYVVDPNGTDGKASFQLPNPDPENDGVTVYSVWARPLGKPGGKSTMTTCALDATGVEWCSTEQLVSVRTKGGQKFTDVSRQLLYMYVDLDGDGVTERYPLFSDALQDYFWDYDNQGMKLLQLRFYEQPSNVN